jgi:NAD(P)-dependent dehydrogenase (short-subunit alcohol dehydrogenase family)
LSASPTLAIAGRSIVDLSDKVAIVTGGASGMGRASALLLAHRGALVHVVDQNREAAEAAAEATGGRAHVGSVAEASFCTEVVADVQHTDGRIDVLVNAAGIIVRRAAYETSTEDWHRIFRVNVDGVFFMSRAVIPGMIAAEAGAIVNFGSVWGDLGSAGHAAYAATKGAVHQLTRSMALEHARQGIRVNAVCPGEIRTPMLAAERSHPPTEADLDHLADATVPMGRLGEPEEVAEVVAFLASDAASYMTGATVAVDAGYGVR